MLNVFSVLTFPLRNALRWVSTYNSIIFHWFMSLSRTELRKIYCIKHTFFKLPIIQVLKSLVKRISIFESSYSAKNKLLSIVLTFGSSCEILWEFLMHIFSKGKKSFINCFVIWIFNIQAKLLIKIIILVKTKMTHEGSKNLMLNFCMERNNSWFYLQKIIASSIKCFHLSIDLVFQINNLLCVTY